ncbi:MAG: isoprenylcysteine carboxylmethyltransferase family protein [Planctomycetaceae bacterium]|nr:isoprenylcysteine carboxylmethyltransferase family protein [Planctomycetaceae bacterium]
MTIATSPHLPADERKLGLSVRKFADDFRVPMSYVLFTALVAWEILDSTPAKSGHEIGLGISFIALGLAWRSWAAGTLHKGISLAVAGPYSLCRHPLYLGSALMMAGFCHLICRPSHYLPVLGILLSIYVCTMAQEETRIAQRYGLAWNGYAACTPRLFPWRPLSYRPGRWELRMWLRNHEYRAVLGVAAGLLGFAASRYFVLGL